MIPARNDAERAWGCAIDAAITFGYGHCAKQSSPVRLGCRCVVSPCAQPHVESPHSPGGTMNGSFSSKLSRRAAIGAGVALAGTSLTACGVPGTSDDQETPEPTATVAPTQAPLAPTQPPISSPVAGYLDPERWAGRSLVVASPCTLAKPSMPSTRRSSTRSRWPPGRRCATRNWAATASPA